MTVIIGQSHVMKTVEHGEPAEPKMIFEVRAVLTHGHTMAWGSLKLSLHKSGAFPFWKDVLKTLCANNGVEYKIGNCWVKATKNKFWEDRATAHPKSLAAFTELMKAPPGS